MIIVFYYSKLDFETMFKHSIDDIRNGLGINMNRSITLLEICAVGASFQVKHYHIQQADGLFWVNEKNKFGSVEEVCSAFIFYPVLVVYFNV